MYSFRVPERAPFHNISTLLCADLYGFAEYKCVDVSAERSLQFNSNDDDDDDDNNAGCAVRAFVRSKERNYVLRMKE